MSQLFLFLIYTYCFFDYRTTYFLMKLDFVVAGIGLLGAYQEDSDDEDSGNRGGFLRV